MILHFFDFNKQSVRIHMENAVFSPTSIQLRIANITKKHAENHEIHCKNEKKEK